MELIETGLPGLTIIQPKVFGDPRGFFLETYSAKRYQECGIPDGFVQDNLSYSTYGILRGMHFQNPQLQGKLVTVLRGEVYDVAVDIRKGSPTFGKWYGVYLNEATLKQLWVPPGFAHGFVVTSDSALFSYKCDAYYSPKSEHSLLWNDPDLGIEWPVEAPSLSDRDRNGKRLRDFAEHELPEYRLSRN